MLVGSGTGQSMEVEWRRTGGGLSEQGRSNVGVQGGGDVEGTPARVSQLQVSLFRISARARYCHGPRRSDDFAETRSASPELGLCTLHSRYDI